MLTMNWMLQQMPVETTRSWSPSLSNPPDSSVRIIVRPDTRKVALGIELRDCIGELSRTIVQVNGAFRE